MFQGGFAKLKTDSSYFSTEVSLFFRLLKEFFWLSLLTQKQLKRFYSGFFFFFLRSALGQNLNMKGFSWKNEI